MFFSQLRHAFRRLHLDPGFTVAAILTLALGIGANLAVFAGVEAVLLRPLPYQGANELVTLRHRDQATGITKEFIAIGDYIDVASRQQAFQSIGGYGSVQATIFGEGEPYQVPALLATPSLLAMLDLRPAAGRSFTPEDGVIGAGPVAILGHDLWRTRFGSDPAAIGRSVRIGGENWTIVGVAPEGFRFPPQAATGIILNQTTPAQAPTGRRSEWTFALGRLKAGTSLADADLDLARVSKVLERDFPDQNKGSTYYAQSLRDATVGSTKTPLILLLAAVGVVLLIASANVANLLLARSFGRRRELAVRMTLGASRSRLVGQLLTESLALALVAGGVGLGIAVIGARGLGSMVPESAAPPDLGSIGLNGPVLAFGLLVVLLTAFGCGLVAALSTPVENAAQHFVGSGKTTMSAAARRATAGLVVAEVALAVVLLLGAGLIIRSFAGLVSVDPGFKVDGVLTMTVSLPADRYSEEPAREAFWQRALTAIGAVPGVEAVGVAVVTPLTGNNWTAGFERADQVLAVGERAPEVGWQLASAGYFQALKIPLRHGRYFDRQDHLGSPSVVIVSEALERRFFPGDSAVGHRIRVGKETAEIVGVVGSIRRAGFRDEPRADLYFPFELSPQTAMTLFVRGAGDPEQMTVPVKSALRQIESNVVTLNSAPFSRIAANSVRDTRLVLWLLGVFAVVALLLAAVGISGVMAFAVRQRTREIGTRIALGADRGTIIRMVMRQGGAMAALGAVIGLAVGVVATRGLQSLLYGVSPYDPLVVAAAIVILVGTTLAACYIPARRAASVDPARTLQES